MFIKRSPRLPTDREVLRSIYDEYVDEYPGNRFEDGLTGPNDPLMEIDIPKVSTILGCRPELLHGILYFHLNQKYGYQIQDNTYVRIFEKKAGSRAHCVNFPFLAAKLSALEEEHRKTQITRGLSILALVVSGIALGSRLLGWG